MKHSLVETPNLYRTSYYPPTSRPHAFDSSLGGTSKADRIPLSTFLKSNGLDNDRTIFLTIASKEYAKQMINFKLSLEKWKLEQNYVVLCLDIDCLDVAESHNILAYARYLISEEDANGDWHIPVARIKVSLSCTFLTRVVYGEHRPSRWWVQLSDHRW